MKFLLEDAQKNLFKINLNVDYGNRGVARRKKEKKDDAIRKLIYSGRCNQGPLSPWVFG